MLTVPVFTLEQMLAWRDHPQVTGLAEMMDYPGVISGQNALLDKLDAFRHLTLDGHCPGLGGKNLTPILLRVLKTATKVISWKKDAGNYNSACR
ncbi:adenine deaminase [Escherichia coli]|nr:adenine deaminase [Escherichia coli]